MKTKQENKAALFSVYRDFCRRYLASEKKVLAAAVLCGAFAAATAGFGLPMMMDKVFPIVFLCKMHKIFLNFIQNISLQETSHRQ